MINTAARVYFTLAVLAIATAIGYGAGVGDRDGAWLLWFLAMAALGAGVVVAGSGASDRARWIGPDTPPPDTVVVSRSVSTQPSNWPIVAAAAAGLLAIGLSAGAPLVVIGLIGGLIAAGGWLGQAWRDDPGWTGTQAAHLSDRFLAPFALPVAALAAVAVIVISISRVLLAVNEKASVAVALTYAVLVLLGFAFVASRPRTTRTLIGLLGGFAALAVVGAGIAGAAKGERTFEPAAAPGDHFTVIAHNVNFNVSSLSFTAGRPATVTFKNEDPATYHNIAIWTQKQGGSPVQESQPIQGPKKKDYVFTVKAPGTYAFRCDFHANMVGTLTVK